MGQNRPVLITANGTGVPDGFGPGFSGDIGRAFAVNPWELIANKMDGLQPPAPPPVYWQPCSYPAAVFPMNPSVAALRVEVNRQIDLQHTIGYPLFLSGYSQSAIAMAQVWVQDILSPVGVHHNRLADLQAGGVINFGDPYRCPGIANGNKVLGFPMPTKLDSETTGGIAGPLVLTPAQTPDNYLSCALDGDLYASCPIGDTPWTNEAAAGKVGTSIYKFIEVGSALSLIAIALDIGVPIGMVEEIFNGIKFAAAGMNAPHWQYEPFVPPAVEWILSRI